MKKVIVAITLVSFVELSSFSLKLNAGVLSTVGKCAATLTVLATLAWPSPNEEKVKFETQPIKEVVGHFMGSGNVMLRLLNRRRAGLNPKEAILETIRHDRKYLFGYFITFMILSSASKTFFKISMNEYEKRTNTMLNAAPKKVLVIESSPRDGWGTNFVLYFFETRYADLSSRNKYISEPNFDVLIKRLKEIPADEKFDRIEIFMHGKADKAAAGDGKVIDGERLEQLKNAQLCLTVPGADIRFMTCSLVRGTPFKRSNYKYEIKLAKAFAPNARYAYAATRNIGIGNTPRVKSDDWGDNEPSLFFKSIIHFFGIGNFNEFWHQQLPNLWRNYSKSMEGVIQIDLQDGEDQPK